MSEIVWKEIYSIGIEKIDEQHRELFNLVGKISDFSSIKTLIMSDLVDELRNYTQMHFKTEEDLMTKYDYPKLKEHQIEHKEFVKKVESMIDESKSSLYIYTAALSDFIKGWLITHTLGTDLEFGQYLKMLDAEESYENK